jgi:ADP-ribosyl-[dinitrogen reductase] hydrolase
MAKMFTVFMALEALKSANTLCGIMKNSVGYGGDTDTVAAIAVALASQCSDVDQLLPDALVSGLEDGEFGLAYLNKLDAGLISLTQKQKVTTT